MILKLHNSAISVPGAILWLRKNRTSTVIIVFAHNQELIMFYIGLSLPFHKIKSRGNYMSIKVNELFLDCCDWLLALLIHNKPTGNIICHLNLNLVL